MRVVLVRHAESTNNIIEDEIRRQIKQGKLQAEAGYREFVTRRHHDPALSPKGYKQAEALAAAYGHLNVSKVALYSSAVRRSVETVVPLAKRLGANVTVMPNLYEVGGMYNNPHPDHLIHEPAPGMTAKEIRSAFNFMDVTQLPQQGPWNQMKPYDNHEADVRRALEVAAWLLSPDFLALHRDKFVLIVTHSEFMDLLTTAMMSPFPSSANSDSFTHTRAVARLGHAFQNTSLTCFAMTPAKQAGRPNVRMLYLNRIDHLTVPLGGRMENGRAKL